MNTYPLTGLRADNPLAFLAALGTLRIAAARFGNDEVRLRWQTTGGAWSALLEIDAAVEAQADIGTDIGTDAQAAVSVETCLCQTLQAWMQQPSAQAAFAIGDDLTLSLEAFRACSLKAASQASADDRAFADFIAAFGCDAVESLDNGKASGKMADTAFRTMSGAGHQHFLGFMRTLAADCTAEHLHRALFAAWRYDDPLESHTMRWDPVDDVRYALRWRDSSGDPERKRGGAMWGANRLAVEGLPLLPTMPGARGELATTGVSHSRAEGTVWTWPVWQVPCRVDTVRSMLALRQLQAVQPPRAELARMGICEVFRSQRIRQGKYRNFTPARAV